MHFLKVEFLNLSGMFLNDVLRRKRVQNIFLVHYYLKKKKKQWESSAVEWKMCFMWMTSWDWFTQKGFFVKRRSLEWSLEKARSNLKKKVESTQSHEKR